MIHLWHESKQSRRILVLFHGTGGDEYDLLPLARAIDPTASILSLRGNVNEQGMQRFFRRFAPGVYDQASIRHEANAIQIFLCDFLRIQNRSAQDLVFVGFSNGANMIVSLAFLYPDLVHKALLLHGLLALEIIPSADLSATKMFVSIGSADTVIDPRLTLSLISTLRAHNAQVTVFKHAGGHHITEEEAESAQQFLALMD